MWVELCGECYYATVKCHYTSLWLVPPSLDSYVRVSGWGYRKIDRLITSHFTSCGREYSLPDTCGASDCVTILFEALHSADGGSSEAISRWSGLWWSIKIKAGDFFRFSGWGRFVSVAWPPAGHREKSQVCINLLLLLLPIQSIPRYEYYRTLCMYMVGEDNSESLKRFKISRIYI